jgi:Ca2+-binding RTX toxin-like protein
MMTVVQGKLPERTSVMLVETLESRRLMSVVASAAAGTLYVYGDDLANGIRLAIGGIYLHDIVVTQRTTGDNYAEVYRVPDKQVQQIFISGRAGNDKIEVNLQSNRVYIYGGHGADWIKTGGNGCIAWGDYDPLKASQPDDNAADTLLSDTNGDCALFGQGGDDKLYSNGQSQIWLAKTDYLRGGPGKDRFYTPATTYGAYRLVDIKGGTGNDTLYAGPGRNVAFYGEGGADTADFGGFGQSAKIYLNKAGGTKKSGGASLTYLLGEDVENANGTSFDDYIYGNDRNNVLRGGAGYDYVEGAGGNDTIYGGDHSDTLAGGLGNDRIYGEGGNDRLLSGGGIDLLYGGSGEDRFFAKDGGTTGIFGDSGTDLVVSQDAYDIINSVP